MGGTGCNLLLGVLSAEDRERLAIREEDRPLREVLMRAEDIPAVGVLESEELIQHRRNLIELRDREGVMARACECYRPLSDKLLSFSESLG